MTSLVIAFSILPAYTKLPFLHNQDHIYEKCVFHTSVYIILFVRFAVITIIAPGNHCYCGFTFLQMEKRGKQKKKGKAQSMT